MEPSSYILSTILPTQMMELAYIVSSFVVEFVTSIFITVLLSSWSHY